MDVINTAEPDEFARLLAELNAAAETPEQEPAPAPVAVPIAVPIAEPIAVPAALDHATAVAPAVAPVVAPAFGLAAPYPSLPAAPVEAVHDADASDPAAIAFAAPLPPPSIPATPPAPPRAPELIGADELAAPPALIPPSAPLLPVATPDPQRGAPPIAAEATSAADATPPAESTPSLSSFAAPSAAGPPFQADAVPGPLLSAPPFAAAPVEAPSLAAPVFPPPSLAGPTFASNAALPPGDLAGPTSASSGPLPLGDFAALLATPIDADEIPRSPATPLMFGSGAADHDEPDLARPTVGEWIGLALAVVVAPIGLLLGVVAAVRGAHRRGWVVGVVRATIAIGAVLTVALGVGGYFGYVHLKQQQAHDETAAASAAFCSTLTANPGMAELPTFGWPAVAASIPDSLKAMQSFEDRWTKLAKVSPAGIKPDVDKVATAAKQIIDSVTVSRTVDDASDIAVMSSVASASGVPAWQSQYCG
jgi:hypothetical protein